MLCRCDVAANNVDHIDDGTAHNLPADGDADVMVGGVLFLPLQLCALLFLYWAMNGVSNVFIVVCVVFIAGVSQRSCRRWS